MRPANNFFAKSESRLGHVVNLIYCSLQSSLADWRRKPDDDQWLTWSVLCVVDTLSSAATICLLSNFLFFHSDACLMPPSKLSGIRGESLRHSLLFYIVLYSVWHLLSLQVRWSFWDRQFLLPPPAPTILTARLRGV